MTTTPGNASSNLPGKPPVVDLATWQAAREELLVREKAHTHEGDAIAAARRRLPVVELNGGVEGPGVDGPVPFVDLFQGRDELVVYQHMWYDGAPFQGQCEGCTTTAWHVKDAVYLNARGVSFAVLTSGPWDEVAPYVEFMGYTQPWYSVRGVGLAGGGAPPGGPGGRAGPAVDPPRRDSRGTPRPPGPLPLTRVPSGWTWPPPRPRRLHVGMARSRRLAVRRLGRSSMREL